MATAVRASFSEAARSKTDAELTSCGVWVVSGLIPTLATSPLSILNILRIGIYLFGALGYVDPHDANTGSPVASNDPNLTVRDT